MALLLSGDDAPAIPADIANAIVAAGQRMDSRNWVPATAGNLSVRIDADRVAITRSGVHKGRLEADDIIAVDMDGRAVSGEWRASVETPVHCQLYRAFPQAGAVLHGHSVAATILSMTEPGAMLTLAGYEVLKAFEGQSSPDVNLDLALIDNEQDVPRLIRIIAPLLPAMRLGFLIRGHGSYVWGPDLDTALVRFEALEFLLECELAMRRLPSRMA